MTQTVVRTVSDISETEYTQQRIVSPIVAVVRGPQHRAVVSEGSERGRRQQERERERRERERREREREERERKRDRQRQRMCVYERVSEWDGCWRAKWWCELFSGWVSERVSE